MSAIEHPDILVSVIIPTYNRAAFVEEAVRSVLAQDFWRDCDAWELLVVDDGSTDDTRDRLRPYENRIAYTAKPHAGVSAARNLGLRLSRGGYVAFLDSDDLWKPEKISCQVRFLEAHPEAVVVCTEETWIRNGVRVNPREKHRKYSGWVFDKYLPLCLLSLSSALFRRRLFDEIGMFDESLPACEDYDLGIRMARRYPVHMLPEALIVKRGGHDDQLSKQYWGRDRFRVRALIKALDSDLTREQARQVRVELVRKCRILIQGFEKRGKKEDAAAYRGLLETYGKEPEP